MILHTCHGDDTVTSVARQYGVSPVKILEDNGVNPRRPLSDGEILVLFPGAEYHTARGGEGAEQIAASCGISLRRLYRQNPALGGAPFCYPGQILNVDKTPRPRAILCGRIDGYDRAMLRAALPYLDVAILPGGRLRHRRLELPRRQHLPPSVKVCVAIATDGEDPELVAPLLWDEARRNGFDGILPEGPGAAALVSTLSAGKQPGEWVLSPGASDDADGCFCAGSGCRAIHAFQLGAQLTQGTETRTVDEAQKNELLAHWRVPIRRENDAAVAETTILRGERNLSCSLRFCDAEQQKAGFERAYESGVRLFYLERLTDFTAQNRCLFAGCFD